MKPERHPMTRAKFEALRLLAAGPRETTAHTHGAYVGGRVAHCLVREGLARRAWGNLYEITDAGRAALAEVDVNPRDEERSHA